MTCMLISAMPSIGSDEPQDPSHSVRQLAPAPAVYPCIGPGLTWAAEKPTRPVFLQLFHNLPPEGIHHLCRSLELASYNSSFFSDKLTFPCKGEFDSERLHCRIRSLKCQCTVGHYSPNIGRLFSSDTCSSADIDFSQEGKACHP